MSLRLAKWPSWEQIFSLPSKRCTVSLLPEGFPVWNINKTKNKCNMQQSQETDGAPAHLCSLLFPAVSAFWTRYVPRTRPRCVFLRLQLFIWTVISSQRTRPAAKHTHTDTHTHEHAHTHTHTHAPKHAQTHTLISSLICWTGRAACTWCMWSESHACLCVCVCVRVCVCTEWEAACITF